MSAPATEALWYAQGLRFECTRCGKCCSGAPGHVWVTPAECGEIARHLGVSRENFTTDHVRRVGVRLSLLEKRGGDCEFLNRPKGGATGCAIHCVRPRQCRTWPFWSSNLSSPEAWKAAARECPGIGRGPVHALAVIQAALQANGDLPL